MYWDAPEGDNEPGMPLPCVDERSLLALVSPSVSMEDIKAMLEGKGARPPYTLGEVIASPATIATFDATVKKQKKRQKKLAKKLYRALKNYGVHHIRSHTEFDLGGNSTVYSAKEFSRLLAREVSLL
jgi:hypothetical protein